MSSIEYKEKSIATQISIIGREQEAHDIMRRCGAYDLLRSSRDYNSYAASTAEVLPPQTQPEMPGNSNKVRKGLLLESLLLGLGAGVLISFLQRKYIRQFVFSTLQQQFKNITRKGHGMDK